MLSQHINMESEGEHHPLAHKWVLWGHLPHDTDWSIKSFINIATVNTIEETIGITETLPNILIENCMLFLMRENVNPIWEDPMNKQGGYFSYKISNKHVGKVWKELSYVTVGETISNDADFTKNVTGITISPKKNFCIIKIWMSTCRHQNPNLVTNRIKYLTPEGCLFSNHNSKIQDHNKNHKIN
jgi:hypothetical protein